MAVIERISARLDGACADGTTPAAVCVIVRGGAVVHESAHGRIPPGSENDSGAVGPDTPFDVASLTKVMATTAVAIALHSQRRLDLDAPLSRFVLSFVSRRAADEGGGLAAPPRDVTLLDLLTHRSGLPAHRPYWEVVAADRMASRVFTAAAKRPRESNRIAAFRRTRHLMRDLVSAEKLEADPGERAVYSDVGFILLGMALERAGGAALDRLFSELVGGPFGLSDTFFVDEVTRAPRRPLGCAPTRAPNSRGGARLSGEVDDDNAFAMSGVAGHAGLFSTGRDVARFGEALRMVWEGRSLGTLRPWAAREFLQRDTNTRDSTRALGFDTPSPGGSAAGELMDREATFGHLGFTGCSLWMDLSRALTVALLSNRVYGGGGPSRIRALRAEIHDLAVELTGG